VLFRSLIAIVLLFSIVLGALPSTLSNVADALSKLCNRGGNARLRAIPEDEVPAKDGGRTIVGFVTLIIEIGQRISMSLAIQLVAASVNARQPLRFVRILSLFSVAVFFLFLQSGAAVILANGNDNSHKAGSGKTK
jgi:hypothetical protein